MANTRISMIPPEGTKLADALDLHAQMNDILAVAQNMTFEDEQHFIKYVSDRMPRTVMIMSSKDADRLGY